MKEIDRLQNELGLFLASIIPVPWERICLYSKCEKVSRTIRFAVKEKETGIVTTDEFFFDRYDSYLYKEMDTLKMLLQYIRRIYFEYIKTYGEDKIWRTMAYIIEEDGSFHIDFSYEEPVGNILQEREEMLRKYFNIEYQQIEGKYPSLE